MMSQNISFIIDSDVYEKFCLALNLTSESENNAIENCMRWYIAKTFEKVSQDYNPKTIAKDVADVDRDYFGKAIQRIPLWAVKPDQYNHKIIRAYFKSAAETGLATIEDMERLCSDKAVPELYVQRFRSNYAQMKIDTPKSNGKVFEDDGDVVTIWSQVESTLMKYKTNFCD